MRVGLGIEGVKLRCCHLLLLVVFSIARMRKRHVWQLSVGTHHHNQSVVPVPSTEVYVKLRSENQQQTSRFPICHNLLSVPLKKVSDHGALSIDV